MEFDDLWTLKSKSERIWISKCGKFSLKRYTFQGAPLYDCFCVQKGYPYFDYDTETKSQCHKKFIKDNPHVTKNLYSLLYIGK